MAINLYNLFRECGAVCTDTRDIVPGSIFFALKGNSFDGNHFAGRALELGAASAVVDDPTVKHGDNMILVPDTLAALQQLARRHRMESGIPVLAITGTNGKTTTKELTAAVLGAKYNLTVTAGNLNNHIGVPLTLLGIKDDTEFAIIEMGASACGEIQLLCELARPDYGIITNIGKAHLEGFGSIDGIRRGKGELYSWLAANSGMAFYPEQDNVLSAMVSEYEGLHAKGYHYNIADGIKSRLEGEYNRFNIAAAVAVGTYFGIERHEIAESISSYVPSNNRSQRIITNNNIIIADCYNANPSSMAAAIENFAAMETSAEKVLILGDMLELGKDSSDEHIDVIGRLADKGFRNVFLVGYNFKEASRGTGINAYADTGVLMDYLKENPLSEKIVLLKGSRGLKLESLLEIL